MLLLVAVDFAIIVAIAVIIVIIVLEYRFPHHWVFMFVILTTAKTSFQHFHLHRTFILATGIETTKNSIFCVYDCWIKSA